ncbi:hypothetical protein AYO38_07105 [bacterium SCGC AG-212-C10]|nr:hypothetical protein AYO38_07105 [bacterium SCGC AG-212-C10]
MRVIEFAQAMAIPMCGLLLADLGAEVIKVEPPAGDAFRYNQTPILPGESKGYTILNRGKRAICMDFAAAESRHVIARLVRSADVVLVSLKPPDLPRYGLDYETLAAVNPRLIYLEHIPLGPAGPFGESGGYDVVVQGISGTAAVTGVLDGDAPAFVRPAYADNGTGFLSALGVVAALRHRDLTGEGQRVETSLLSTALTLGNNTIHWFAATDPPVLEVFEAELAALRAQGAGFAEQRELWRKRMLPGAFGNIYFRHYRTLDGFISVGCLSPALNARFRKVTGIEDPRQQEGFELGTPEAFDALAALMRRSEDLFRTRTTTDWIAALQAGGVPCGPFNFPHEVFRDPQIAANEYMIELDSPELGPYKTFAPPIRMDRTPTGVRRPSPALDQHTDEILAELEFTEAEIAEMRSAGTVGFRAAERS